MGLKIVNENDSTMKLNLNLKTSDLKKVNSPQQEDTNTGVISKDESKDIHNKETRTKTIREAFNKKKH